MIERYRFSQAQIEAYLDRICIPTSRRIYDASTLSYNDKLIYLRLITKHQLVKIPWENLAQHYSWHRTVNVRPAFLYRKIIESPGRGGYCFEANHLLHALLYSLKFEAYIAGARVYRNADIGYGSFSHLVNIVVIGGVKHLIDGGFGPQAPPYPFPLRAGEEGVQVGTARSRLQYDTMPNYLTPQKVWILQFKSNQEEEFRPMYCFPDVEWTPEDVRGANLEPATDPHTFFTHKVVAVRFTTSAELTDAPGSPQEQSMEAEIDGTLILNHNTLKWRRNSEKKIEITFKTEAERVAALRKYFGIELDEEEQQSILGTAGMISGPFSSQL